MAVKGKDCGVVIAKNIVKRIVPSATITRTSHSPKFRSIRGNQEDVSCKRQTQKQRREAEIPAISG